MAEGISFYNGPAKAMRCHQSACRLNKQQRAYFGHSGTEASEILNDLLEKYVRGGELHLTSPRSCTPVPSEIP